MSAATIPRMVLSSRFSALAPLLPAAHVGEVSDVRPIAMGLSGASVYAVTSSRGELVLRVQAFSDERAQWAQQLAILRRAAESGVAPALVHVDEAAGAVVSQRVAGVPIGTVLGDPAQRERALTSIIEQLRRLHALDASGIAEIDPIAYARSRYQTQRARPGFPVWAGALDALFDAVAGVLARDTRRVLSHNDMNPGNILWDGTRAWLVDWEVASLSHPFFDLAVLTMFLQLPEPAAQRLLALQEQRALDETEHATFASLRQFAAALCGTVFLSIVSDLSILPEPAPTLNDVYAGMRTGKVDLQTPSGQAAMALALLRIGTAT